MKRCYNCEHLKFGDDCAVCDKTGQVIESSGFNALKDRIVGEYVQGLKNEKCKLTEVKSPKGRRVVR